MKSLKNTSFLDACAGKSPSRRPVWMMRQAGRYLPEYRAIRKEVSFLELCRNPDLCAEVTLQPVERLDVDAAILFSDILVVFDAMDVRVDFAPGPMLEDPVRTEAQVRKLRFGDPKEELAYVHNAIRACAKALDHRVPLIGFCGAPFTICSYLVEGKGSRDFENIKGMLFREPKLFGYLIENMTNLLVDYLVAQIDAGVDALQIFDSWAGALSPDDYRQHVLPHTKSLVSRVQEARPGIPIILFLRGNANMLALAKESSADVIGVDWSIDLSNAINILGKERVVQGNLDPMILLGSPENLQHRARLVCEAGKAARGHIFNLGHGISRHTDPEMAKLLIDTVHEQP